MGFMIRGLSRGWVGPMLGLFLFAGGGVLAAEPSGPFRDLSFEAALQQAGKENKIVFVDFFTTWCGPCKMLDTTTWSDPAVIALLKEKTVALRIDAEKEAALAKRYNVRAYPTMALIKPDGTQIDALVGYRDAKAFQADFSDSLAGKTSFARAQEAVDKARGDADKTAQARYQLGQELARAGKDEAALAEFLWCFDDGMANSPGYTGVRVSFLLGSLADLGRHYPPALDAMRQRRDAAKTKMDKTPSDRQAAMDFAGLNHYLNDDEATLAVFEKLPPDDPRRTLIGYHAFNLLLKARRYEEAATVTPYARFKEMFAHLIPAGLPPDAASGIREYAVRSGAGELEALAGAGKTADAQDLLKAILALDKSEKTVAVLREHLVRAGHPELLP